MCPLQTARRARRNRPKPLSKPPSTHSVRCLPSQCVTSPVEFFIFVHDNITIAIIVVGVGDGPWEAMEGYEATLPARRFANFRFVNLSQVMSETPEQPALGFATAALAHIPGSYLSGFEQQGFVCSDQWVACADQLAAIRRLGLLHPNDGDATAQEMADSMNTCCVA
jgi:hypothetical protein